MNELWQPLANNTNSRIAKLMEWTIFLYDFIHFCLVGKWERIEKDGRWFFSSFFSVGSGKARYSPSVKRNDRVRGGRRSVQMTSAHRRTGGGLSSLWRDTCDFHIATGWHWEGNKRRKRPTPSNSVCVYVCPATWNFGKRKKNNCSLLERRVDRWLDATPPAGHQSIANDPETMLHKKEIDLPLGPHPSSFGPFFSNRKPDKK